MSGEPTYCDANFFVKLVLIHEPDADLAREKFDEGGELNTSLLSVPEAHSAIAREARRGALNAEQVAMALDALERVWDRVGFVELNDELAQSAAELLHRYPLSGADAVHLATALYNGVPNTLSFATWDKRLARAARDFGFAVVPDPD